MIRNALFCLLGVLVMALPASGEIIVTIPDVEIPYTATSASFTVEVQFIGAYDVDSYSLFMQLSPLAGASGVTFNSADEATLNYIFDDNVGWDTALLSDLQIAGDDGVSGAPETNEDVTKNMVTVQLDAALTLANVGDQYDVVFFATGAATDIFELDVNGDAQSIPGVTWNPGTIGVVPEPGSVVMLAGLGLASLIFFRRRRKA